MRRVVLVLLGLAVLAGVFFAGRHSGHWFEGKPKVGQAAKPAGYHCPMHPNFRSDRPGDCGICGMKLVPDEPAPAQAGKPQGRILYYRDPHQPEYRSDKPGLNPETGHELEPVYESPESSIYVPAEKQAWIGVRVGPVGRAMFDRPLRVPGRVAVDETRIVRVVSRTGGWIEQVQADFTGQLVRKGEPMVTIYSPELLASQQELLLALKAQREMEKSDMPSMHQHSQSLVESARLRLERHWGMSAQEIVELMMSQTPRRTMTLRAPETGFIQERKAFPNQRVEPDAELYTLADLRRVWIVAEVPEADADGMTEGLAATVEPLTGPGRRFNAQVTYIEPRVEAQTRTLRVRLETANQDYFLKPEMFVTVEFRQGGGSRLAVPEDAVIDTGLRQTVFVTDDGGHFRPRQVRTGARAGGMVEIVSGLRPGEKIALSGAFLLDSETQMKQPAAAAGERHAHD